MSVKKKLMLGLFKEAIRNRGFRGYFKKILISAAVLGLVLTVGTVLIVSYSLNQVNKIFTDATNINIVALERLVSEKAIMLSEEQKATIVPLLKQLANQEQTAEQTKNTETEILSVLSDKQMELVLVQADKIKAEGNKLVAAGRSTIEELINKYTGLSLENGKNLINSLSVWWDVNVKSNNESENLLKQLEGSAQ